MTRIRNRRFESRRALRTVTRYISPRRLAKLKIASGTYHNNTAGEGGVIDSITVYMSIFFYYYYREPNYVIGKYEGHPESYDIYVKSKNAYILMKFTGYVTNIINYFST